MKVVVTGAGGMLARAVRSEFERRSHEVVALDRLQLDVTDRRAVERTLAAIRPDAVVQCAGYTAVDDGEREEALAFAVNATGTANVAGACSQSGTRFVYPSTDYVFDGQATCPYPPDAQPAPVNVYGRSKLAGEMATREVGDFLVVRSSWLYGAGGRNFVANILERARAGEPLRIVDDQRGSPTWTDDLAAALAALLEHGAPPGVYHAANRGETTWYGLACEAVRVARLEVEIVPVRTEDMPRPASRPRYSVLDCSATEAVVGPIQHWRDALALAVREGV